MLRILFEKKKINHPEIADIVYTVYGIVKGILHKKKNAKDIVCFFIQIVIITEYLVLHFFTYNILGRVIILVSGYLFINQVEPITMLLASYLLLSVYTALLVVFYVEMQIPICRSLLIEIISQPVFDAYVGTNPGTGHLKTGLALLASTVGVGTVGFGIHCGIDVTRRTWLGGGYIKDCQAGGILPEEATLKKIYTSKAPSTFETVWGNLDPYAKGTIS